MQIPRHPNDSSSSSVLLKRTPSEAPELRKKPPRCPPSASRTKRSWPYCDGESISCLSTESRRAPPRPTRARRAGGAIDALIQMMDVVLAKPVQHCDVHPMVLVTRPEMHGLSRMKEIGVEDYGPVLLVRYSKRACLFTMQEGTDSSQFAVIAVKIPVQRRLHIVNNQPSRFPVEVGVVGRDPKIHVAPPRNRRAWSNLPEAFVRS